MIDRTLERKIRSLVSTKTWRGSPGTGLNALAEVGLDLCRGDPVLLQRVPVPHRDGLLLHRLPADGDSDGRPLLGLPADPAAAPPPPLAAPPHRRAPVLDPPRPHLPHALH